MLDRVAVCPVHAYYYLALYAPTSDDRAGSREAESFGWQASLATGKGQHATNRKKKKEKRKITLDNALNDALTAAACMRESQQH